MSPKLADPDFEPTDEQLRELSRLAFADAEERHQRALKKLFEEIEAGRQANDTSSSSGT